VYKLITEEWSQMELQIDEMYPVSLNAALDLLKSNPDLTIVAGGTDVVVNYKRDPDKFGRFIFIDKIGELRHISFNSEQLIIGALTTHREIETSVLIKDGYTTLAQGARSVGSVQIRNAATIGGNLCSGLPSADTASPLLVLDAKVLLVNSVRERLVKLEDFFVSPGKTIINKDEILREVIIPKTSKRSASSYVKHAKRKSLELAMIGAAVFLEIDDYGICSIARIALTTAAPVPMRAKKAEEFLTAEPLSIERLNMAAVIAGEEAFPRTSWRCSAEYRKAVLPVLVKRAGIEVFSKIYNS